MLLLKIKAHREWRQEMPLWYTGQDTLLVLPFLLLVWCCRGLVASAPGLSNAMSFSIQYSRPVPDPFSFIAECALKIKLLSNLVSFPMFSSKIPSRIADIDWSLDGRYCHFPYTCYVLPRASGHPQSSPPPSPRLENLTITSSITLPHSRLLRPISPRPSDFTVYTPMSKAFRKARSCALHCPALHWNYAYLLTSFPNCKFLVSEERHVSSYPQGLV